MHVLRIYAGVGRVCIIIWNWGGANELTPLLECVGPVHSYAIHTELNIFMILWHSLGGIIWSFGVKVLVTSTFFLFICPDFCMYFVFTSLSIHCASNKGRTKVMLGSPRYSRKSADLLRQLKDSVYVFC